MTPLGPGGFLSVLSGAVSVIGTVVMLAVATALVILLARFLVIGTRAAQLYIANHAASGPPPNPGPGPTPPPYPTPAHPTPPYPTPATRSDADTDDPSAQTTAPDRAPLVDDTKRPFSDAAPRPARKSPPKAAPRAANGIVPPPDPTSETTADSPRPGA